MDESLCTNPELQIFEERSRKYQGTAKININRIIPHPSVSQRINTKNIERLCEVFDKEGCRRLDIYNHVSAVVSRQHLHEALQAARVSTADLLTDQPSRYPHLHFPTGSVKCLHGQHRLKAGEHYLPLVDQWWTVDLYLDDISADLQSSLVDEYSNERVPTDGEIYIKIRQYRNEANAHFEKRWLSRLSENKARRLRGLEAHPSVRAAFDSLLVLPSLLIHGMQIGSLPRALAISCDEEIVHALTRLLQYWSSLVGCDCGKMLRIDTHTVEALQLLAPGVSLKDRTTVKGLVHSGQVFSKFTESERSSIWKRLKKTQGIIPSLYTFFKDLWYLESCANCIKQLITPSRSFPTIRSAVRAAFLTLDPAHKQFLIQTSETGFRSYSYSQGDPAELGYRQLWLYAMRHYPKLPKTPRNKRLAKPIREMAEPMILYDMAVFAKRLGFQSPQIEQLIQQSPDRKIAHDALLSARRPDLYRYNEEEIESLINNVIECFLKATPLEHHQLPVQIDDGRETKKESRCGHPQTQAQLQDCWFLFIDQIHGDSIQEKRKATSILVRSSVYLTFFSKLPIPGVDSNPAGAFPNPELPMSPLFVPNNPSLQDKEAEAIGAADIVAGQTSHLGRRSFKDAHRKRRQEKRAAKLRRRQQRKKRTVQTLRAARHSLSSSRTVSTLPPQSGMEIGGIYLLGSDLEEALEPVTETEAGSSGSMNIIGGDDQGLPDLEPFVADGHQDRESIGEEQSFSENDTSDSRAEDEQLWEGKEKNMVGRESLEDAFMGQHGSEHVDEKTKTAAQSPPAEEFQRTLDQLAAWQLIRELGLIETQAKEPLSK